MMELRVQHVYFALVFLPPVMASSSHIGGDEEMPKSSVGTKVGGMVDCPSSQ